MFAGAIISVAGNAGKALCEPKDSLVGGGRGPYAARQCADDSMCN
jgi:hypothetical protein